jgi:hypothetical protein
LVSWKGAVAVAALLAALGGYLWLSRPQPAPAKPAFIPCDVSNTVDVLVVGAAGDRVEIARGAPDTPWMVKQPVAAPADPVFAQDMVQNLNAVSVQNTIASPGPSAGYGLDAPRDVVTCRVNSGASFTLVVGKESFDQGGYYARRSGDARVYIVGSAAVDQLDRRLTDPPIQGSAGPSPSPSPSPSQ